MPERLVTTMCYIEQGEKILFLYRNKKKNDASAGKWIGVGGKAMPGENPEACMLREVKEETGFDLTSWHFCGKVVFLSDEWPDEDMYIYTSDAFMPAPDTPIVDGLPLPDCNEGTLGWIERGDVFDLSLWEGDRLFLRKLLDGEDVSMTLTYRNDRLVSAE